MLPSARDAELRTLRECDISKLLSIASCVSKPRHFSIAAGGNRGIGIPKPLALLDSQAALLDHATTVKFRLIRCQWSTFKTRWFPKQTLALLLAQEPSLEKLTVHGLSQGQGGPTIARPTSAPSLTSLDLLWSSDTSASLTRIDAPNLRELPVMSTCCPSSRWLRYLLSRRGAPVRQPRRRSERCSQSSLGQSQAFH